ncbi:hypothetical protein CC78DRAFT_4766 [Lojkania enalia]|uniref:Uncharacterized protein n=1 Tax=Lojkania enalia TaxID=147567 RepID=A0A9P4NCU8_9PLEO|nr:hypothetical protein CC78DRAFT_4766 [Didymosphaeria enalia]
MPDSFPQPESEPVSRQQKTFETAPEPDLPQETMTEQTKSSLRRGAASSSKPPDLIFLDDTQSNVTSQKPSLADSPTTILDESPDVTTQAQQEISIEEAQQHTQTFTEPSPLPNGRWIESETEELQDPAPESSSLHSSILDELLALYEYNATPALVSTQQENTIESALEDMTQKASRMTPRSRILRERSSSAPAVPLEPYKISPVRQLPVTSLNRETSISGTEEDVAPDAALFVESRPALVKRRPTVSFNKISEEMSPTSDPFVQLVSRASINIICSESKAPVEPHRKISKLSTPRATNELTPSPANYRKLSSAPGIVAPPVQVLQHNMKPANPIVKPRDKVYVPPKQQYPPAPPYPVRDTPPWTQPDLYEPLKETKAQPGIRSKRKKGIFAWAGKQKQKVKTQHRAPPISRRPLSDSLHRLPHIQAPEIAAPSPHLHLSNRSLLTILVGTVARPSKKPRQNPSNHQPKPGFRPVPFDYPRRRAGHYPGPIPAFFMKDQYLPSDPILRSRIHGYSHPILAPV